MSPKSIRVCVVGAGPSGLSVLYHVNKMKGCNSNNFDYEDNVNIDVVCYEKHSTMGGLWNMSWRVGKMMHQKIAEYTQVTNYEFLFLYRHFHLAKAN